jgi:hypothetical protein
MRLTTVAGGVALALTLAAPAAAPAVNHPDRAGLRSPGSPGAAGVGDPYYPRDGNGGYDVRHYDLALAYAPSTDRLRGIATITARATKDLSAFNLDLDGLHVRSVRVDDDRVRWSRARGELTVDPRRRLARGHRFTTVVRYAGVPRTLSAFGASGFLHTDDGAMVAGQPHSAATWFPANDHPSDKASYTFHITVPRRLTAVANGRLVGHRQSGRHATWTWRAKAPMASYLATVDIGDFQLRHYRADGVPAWDAIDPDLFAPFAIPRTGTRLAISQRADSSYKRLSRRVNVPAEGATLTFSVSRDTEPDWDFLFVEARPVGTSDWTTLPDKNGHTSRSTGFACPYWLRLHPFLRHYQSRTDDGCAPRGTTGRWWAASGSSDGWERWSTSLTRFAGQSVQVSITYASDDTFQTPGVFVDDVVVSSGPGTTSFENDGSPLDGWIVPGPPAGSPPNANDWIAGTVDDEPPPPGRVAQRSFARHDEILRFLSGHFGPYPFGTTGGIVDSDDRVGFALETQTRPVYSFFFFLNFFSPHDGDFVVVHELAHQWYGDSLTLRRWRHIWLNEGFATYAEWLWAEREGLATPRQQFNFLYDAIPARDPFWDVVIGDPGRELLFDGAVYTRGAMTLQRLRQRVGDADFFTILRRWARAEAGGLVTTREFVRLAERISGRPLDRLVETWLFTARKPDLSPAATRQQPPARWSPGGRTATVLQELKASSD